MPKFTVPRVKDLIQLLSQCDPEGEIKISLDEAISYGDDQIGNALYSFAPVVDCSFSHTEKTLADSVHFELSEDDTRLLIQHRSIDTAPHEPATLNSIASDAPVAIAVAVSNETYSNLQVVVTSCNEANKSREGATTHGNLTVSSLLGMMAEDLAMTNTRPGSWEGSNMQQVLDSHGYQ